MSSPAATLGRTLARVRDLDEDSVRGELELRFNDRETIEHGLAAWRAAHQGERHNRERADLA